MTEDGRYKIIKKSEATHMVFGRLPSSSIRTITVGSGISPDQPPKRVADYTAGGELHPALKIKYVVKSRV